MVLIFQSIYVAVTGFWRYLIALPFILILIFALWAVGHAIVPSWTPQISETLLVLAFLFAIRSALATLGEGGRPVITRLVVLSIVFVVIEFALIAPLAWGGLWALTPTDVAPFHLPHDQREFFEPLIQPLRQILYLFSFLFLLILLFCALRVALMVPMAAAAWASSANRQNTDLMWGFGASFLPLSVICLTSFGLESKFQTFTKPDALMTLTLDWGMAKLRHMPLPPVRIERIIDLGLGVTLELLLFYWQATAAALAFLRLRKRLEARQTRDQPKAERVDPRTLRKARETQSDNLTAP